MPAFSRPAAGQRRCVLWLWDARTSTEAATSFEQCSPRGGKPPCCSSPSYSSQAYIIFHTYPIRIFDLFIYLYLWALVVAMCFSSPVFSRMTVRFAKGRLRRMIRIICKNLVDIPDFPKYFVILDRPLYNGWEGWSGSFAKTCCCARPFYLQQPSPECWPASITKKRPTKMSYLQQPSPEWWPALFTK